MAEQWRIFVVEDEHNLNRNIVNTLRKDGYFVQGVISGADAVRVLWSEEYDIAICDLKSSGADAFELLQWLRAYRPNTRVIIVGFSSEEARTQALESGAVSYLEKPLDLHVLREELRRLLQQTGFSANLDSFDLLDVIQIITMSRKSIALLVNTGLEEHGVLRFQGGELIWAEYGLLRGEEAFFALAAHKNGTVLHQPWNEQIMPNVTQPLSRLIFQALQYRTKYAHMQQLSGEHAAIASESLQGVEEDDSPFAILTEFSEGQPIQMQGEPLKTPVLHPEPVMTEREWWEQTGQIPLSTNGAGQRPSPDVNISVAPTMAMDVNEISNSAIVPAIVHKTPASQRTDLPSWLTEQPTSSMPAIRPTSPSGSAQIPATPAPKPTSAEWNTPSPITGEVKPAGVPQMTGTQKSISTDTGMRKAASAEWVASEQVSHARLRSIPLQSLSTPTKTGELPSSQESESSAYTASALTDSQRAVKKNYNYTALVSALQTLGYSIKGFIAAAVVSLDGQPIAQVAIDDLDISRMCKQLSNTLKLVLQSLEQGDWGEHEDTVITSAGRHILIHIVGSEKTAFQVLITTRETDPTESLEVMANIEGAVSAALR